MVGDTPFMSYQASLEEGIRNAGRLVKEGGAEAVKLEGGAEYAELSRRLSRIGIPVMGHIGLTPQSATMLGGFPWPLFPMVAAAMNLARTMVQKQDIIEEETRRLEKRERKELRKREED